MTTIVEPLGNIIHSTWLAEEERLQKVECIFDKEVMSSINIQIIYLNTHDYIDKITCSTQSLTLSDNGAVLEKEKLLKLIQTYKIDNKNTKYKLLDIFLCNFDVSPSSISLFSTSSNDIENAKTYIKTVSSIDDLFIPASVFMFHDVNTLYFIYQEYEIVKNNIPLKSILKSDVKSINGEQPKKRATKKVRISIKDNTQYPPTNKRKTRRRRH
jgi:hypothetical protein